MNPDVVVVIAALIFVAVAIGIDRWASVKKDQSAVEMQKDLSQKLVDAMRSMSGQGLAGDVMRSMGSAIIDVDPGDGRVANGRSQRDNGNHRVPEGFAQPRVGTESR